MKEYLVPFTLEGKFNLKAKNVADLKVKLDSMMIGDLMATSYDIELKAYPDRSEKIGEFNEKAKIKFIPNK